MKESWRYIPAGIIGLILLAVPVMAEESTGGSFSYTVEDSCAVITAYTGIEEHVTVPAEIDGYPVARVGARFIAENARSVVKTVTFSEGITGAAKECLYGLSALEEVILPASLEFVYEYSGTAIGEGLGVPVYSCPNLKAIQADAANPYVTDVDGVLYTKDMTSLLLYPPAAEQETFVIPDGVQKIQSNSCSDNSYVKEVIMPDSVTYVGYWCFDSDRALETVTFSDNCTFIGQYAFSGTAMKTVEIPAAVDSLLPFAFGGSVIETVTVDVQNANFYSIDGVLFQDGQLVYYPSARPDSQYTIPEGTVSIGEIAFDCAYSLRTIVLNEGLTSIEKNAFWICSSLSGMEIPDSVSSIGKDAFYGCSSLQLQVSPNHAAENYAIANHISYRYKDAYSGLYKCNGTWVYLENGVIASGFTGLVKNNGVWYYVADGVLDWNYTGLCKNTGIWFYVANGMVDWSFTGLTKYNGAWFYVANGMIDWSFTGFCKNQGIWFYVSGGMVDWNFTGLAKFNGIWFYAKNGMIDWSYTGLCKNQGIWFYVYGGMVDWSFTGVTKYNGIWFYVDGGMLDWDYTGLCMNNGVLYYVDGGMIDWNYTGPAAYDGTKYEVIGGYVR